MRTGFTLLAGMLAALNKAGYDGKRIENAVQARIGQLPKSKETSSLGYSRWTKKVKGVRGSNGFFLEYPENCHICRFAAFHDSFAASSLLKELPEFPLPNHDKEIMAWLEKFQETKLASVKPAKNGKAKDNEALIENNRLTGVIA